MTSLNYDRAACLLKSSFANAVTVWNIGLGLIIVGMVCVLYVTLTIQVKLKSWNLKEKSNDKAKRQSKSLGEIA